MLFFFLEQITCEANKKKGHTPFTFLELFYTTFKFHSQY